MKTVLSLGCWGKGFGLFLLLAVAIWLGCAPSDRVTELTARDINLRDAWPAGFSRPPKTMSLADGCALVHGPNARLFVKGDTLMCDGDPSQPPLMLRQQAARYDLMNDRPWGVAGSDDDMQWPPPLINFPLASLLPLPGGGFRFTGAVRHRDSTPWDGFRLYVLHPDGSALPVGNCIRGAVRPKQPLAAGSLRVLSCSLEPGFVTMHKDTAGLWLAYGYRRRGEPTALTALRMSPLRLRIPMQQPQTVIVSPGIAYGVLEQGRPQKPRKLDTHTVALLTGTEGSYYLIGPHPSFPFPAGHLYVRAKPAPGKAQILHVLTALRPPPDATMISAPHPPGHALAAAPQHDDERNIWLAVSQTGGDGTPVLQWFDCRARSGGYRCQSDSGAVSGSATPPPFP